MLSSPGALICTTLVVADSKYLSVFHEPHCALTGKISALSDAVTYNLTNAFSNCGSLTQWGGDAEPNIVTTQNGEEFTFIANLAAVTNSNDARSFFTAAGVRVKSDNTLEANQLRVLGSRVCWWLKCL